jgi:hypothetical protein
MISDNFDEFIGARCSVKLYSIENAPEPDFGDDGVWFDAKITGVQYHYEEKFPYNLTCSLLVELDDPSVLTYDELYDLNLWGVDPIDCCDINMDDVNENLKKLYKPFNSVAPN